MIRSILALVMCWCATISTAQDFTGLARVDVAESHVRETPNGLTLQLMLSQGVPYRVFTLDDPARLVLDFREIDWANMAPEDLIESDQILDVRVGSFRPRWSRMVLCLANPYVFTASALDIDDTSGQAMLQVDLSSATQDVFAAASGEPQLPGWELPEVGLGAVHKPRQKGDKPLVVVLDPGHGGIDPGAEQGQIREKDLMLSFARELQDVMVRAGGV